MRISQFFAMSVVCRFISLLLVFVTGCELYFGDVETDKPDAGSPDAEVTNPTCASLGCAQAPSGSAVAWEPCLPGSETCYCLSPPVACDPTPTCVSMGCDGTQSVPLYCPEGQDTCFCAAPHGPDGWCVDPPLVEAFLSTDEGNSASVNFKVNCPKGTPDGPHRGAVELFAGMEVAGIESFTWTCSASEHTFTWIRLPCGTDIWARAVALHPTTGEPTYLLTVHSSTASCNL